MRRMLGGLWVALLLTMAGIDPVRGQDSPEPDFPAPEIHAVRGEQAAAILSRIERVAGGTLPRGDLLIFTAPGVETALFWIFIDGVPIGTGYCSKPLIAALLDRAA
jgi:hypothetical protein